MWKSLGHLRARCMSFSDDCHCTPASVMPLMPLAGSAARKVARSVSVSMVLLQEGLPRRPQGAGQGDRQHGGHAVGR